MKTESSLVLNKMSGLSIMFIKCDTSTLGTSDAVWFEWKWILF